MSNGWIKLQRAFLEWEWYDDSNVKMLFIHCLLMANHKDKKYRGTVVKRGSFLTGRELLSAETGLSISQVRTSLNKLKSTSELTIEKSSKGTLIKVVNYDKHQCNDQQSDQPMTNESPASDQQVATNKNDKKVKNEKKTIAETQAIAWTSAGGWSGITDEDRENWKEAYPACNIDRQLAATSEWLKSNPSKARKTNWRRFLTNWLAREQEKGGDIKSKKTIDPMYRHF